MAYLESRSDISRRKARNFFLPTGAEAILYLLVSAIVLVVLNYGNILGRLSSRGIDLNRHLNANVDSLSSNFSHTLTSSLGGRLGQMILWSLVGAAAYIILWLAKNLLNSFENDIITTGYVHPPSYSNINYWESSLSVKIFLFVISIVSIVYGYLLIRVALPSLAVFVGGAAYNFNLTSPFYIAAGIVGSAVFLYGFTLLMRVIARLWKLL